MRTKILESAAGLIVREARRERDLLHKNVRSNSVIHMVCALRVRFGPPALTVANYPEDSAVAFWKKPMPFCLSSTGPGAICRVPFSLIVLEVPIGEVTWLC